MGDEFAVFGRLAQVLHERNVSRPAGSYTTALLSGGVGQIGAKLREEATEITEAAAESDDAGRQNLVREAADLMFHLLVLLEYRGTSLTEVAAELARREGIGGLEEKRSRG